MRIPIIYWLSEELKRFMLNLPLHAITVVACVPVAKS